jgi:AcrR family transcriptional regulator
MHVYNSCVPPPRNKHQRKTEATRRKLLAAALRVFARDGFERSRLEDIAAEAGHTRGAFYANFATKADLFIALLEQQAGKRISEFSRLLQSHSSQEDSRPAMREFYLSRAKDRQWVMLTLEFKLYALRHREHRAQLAAAHRRIRESSQLELISKLKPTPTTGPYADKQAKILLEIVLGGLVLEHAYDPQRISADEVIYLLGRMFDWVTLEKLP